MVIVTAVTAAVFKLVVYIFKRFTKKDTSSSSLGNKNVVLNGGSSNSGTINTGTVNHRDPTDSRVISNQLDQINQLKITNTEKNAQVRDLRHTVEELRLISKGQGDLASMANEALIRLANSDGSVNVEFAKELKIITEKYEDQRIRDDLIAAQLYRGRGALSYTNNTLESLGHYQRAIELDPKNVDGWNQQGHLQRRMGELDNALNSYKKVEKLATESTHKAVAYGNMGNIFQTQGDLDQAMQMYQKSLDINEALGRKEGIAIQYGNMGKIFQMQGDLDQARNVWTMALVLFTELGSPHAKTVQLWLYSLKKSK